MASALSDTDWSTLVDIDVGEERHRFRMYKTLATRQSEFLKAATDSRWNDGKPIDLTDEDTRVFAIFAEWVQYRKMGSKAWSSAETSLIPESATAIHLGTEIYLLILAYGLGLRLLASRFCDAVVSMLEVMVKENSSPLAPAHINQAYEITTPSSALRRLLVDNFIEQSVLEKVDALDDSYHHEFLAALAPILMKHCVEWSKKEASRPYSLSSGLYQRLPSSMNEASRHCGLYMQEDKGITNVNLNSSPCEYHEHATNEVCNLSKSKGLFLRLLNEEHFHYTRILVGQERHAFHVPMHLLSQFFHNFDTDAQAQDLEMFYLEKSTFIVWLQYILLGLEPVELLRSIMEEAADLESPCFDLIHLYHAGVILNDLKLRNGIINAMVEWTKLSKRVPSSKIIDRAFTLLGSHTGSIHQMHSSRLNPLLLLLTAMHAWNCALTISTNVELLQTLAIFQMSIRDKLLDLLDSSEENKTQSAPYDGNGLCAYFHEHEAADCMQGLTSTCMNPLEYSDYFPTPAPFSWMGTPLDESKELRVSPSNLVENCVNRVRVATSLDANREAGDHSSDIYALRKISATGNVNKVGRYAPSSGQGRRRRQRYDNQSSASDDEDD